MARAGESRMAGGHVRLLMVVGVLVVGDWWSVGAAPAKFDVREHIGSSAG